MVESLGRQPADAPAVLLSESVDARSLEALRERVGEIGQRYGLTDLGLTKFVLVVHELAVNAVRHGGGRGEIRVWPAGTALCCEVSDHGRGIPTRYIDDRRRPSVTHIGGWGLWLVRQICPDVRVDTGRAGTRIVICFPIGGRD
jgi:anti-sigma regulatory factor (Ser/Thr protein kinase)